MNRSRARIAALVALVGIVLGIGAALTGTRLNRSPIAERPTAEPSAVPTRPRQPYTPIPEGEVSPQVVRRSPERGAELPPGEAIELTFDRAMNRPAVEAAFDISPAVAGSIEWPDARTLVFRPAQPLERAALYDVALNQEARAEDGARLNEAYQFRFATAGYLQVGQAIPADGAQDVRTTSTISVMFNRPVVPLTSVEQQEQLPQPLRFAPALEGTGEWLTTSIYVYRPARPLAGGTTYTARLAADLTDFDGNPIDGEYAWSFTTARPQVLSALPEDRARMVSLEPTIRLQFNQAIDPASAASAFTLRAPDGTSVPGAVEVVDQTLSFTPSRRLEHDTGYHIEVAAGLGSSSGGSGMAANFSSAFHTVPLPRIVRTEPADGGRAAAPHTDFAIYFTAPIDPASVMANLEMTPPLSPTQVYTYFNTHDNSFHLAFDMQPSTDYSVRIGPNIADPYGNTTGQPLTVNFTTGPLPPSAELVMPAGTGTYDASRPSRIAISSTNKDEVSITLYRLPPEILKTPFWGDRIPAGATLLRQWNEPLSSPLNIRTITYIDLVEGGGSLDPGTYLLQLAQSHGHQNHLMIVSNLNLTLKGGERDALIWAHDLRSGGPVAGLELELYNDQGALLGTATTDSNGVARTRLDRREHNGLVAIAHSPFAAMSLAWSWNSSLWDMGIAGTSDLPELAAHVYTDRPIYRPGQMVNIKGILRAEDDVRFSLPSSFRTVNLSISDAAGAELYKQALELTTNGTFTGSLELGADAALGIYRIDLLAGRQTFSFPFQVAEYRPPEFEVSVIPQAPEIVRGSSTRAVVNVAYFFGGPVANIPVAWNITAQPYSFAPEWAGRYRFSDDEDPWGCWHCWWRPAPPAEPILRGSGSTDDQGRLEIEVPAELVAGNGEPITNSVKLTIEAVASGRDNQVIAGRAEMIVHSSPLYVGLASQTYLGSAGEAWTVDLVVADSAGRRVPRQAVDVEIFKYTWENKFIRGEGGLGRWEWAERRALVDTQQVASDDNGEALVRFTPRDGGAYRVVATARAGGGREARSSLYLWVAGDSSVSWRRDNNDTVNLIADRTSYKVGETAEILIPSPFQSPHWALITIERGGILSHEVRRIQRSSSSISLPLTAAHAPNIFVSVVLFSPPDAQAASGPLPADYKFGILPIAVEPDPQSLRITVTPETKRAEPGSSVTYSLQVNDASGRPVAAELSLDLVDEAVLSLQPRTPNAILQAFYQQRPLGIATANGLSISADRLQQYIEEQLSREQAAGRAGMRRDETTGFAPPAAVAEEGAAGASGVAADTAAGNQAAAAPTLTIREEFSDTAYWNARVTTGADGRATIEVALPDNLTTWVMRAVGLTADTLVGEGTAELVASKPLLIRPVTPRFFVVGDMAELAANISNNTDTRMQVQVGLATSGLDVSTPLTRTVDVPANGEAQVTWQVSARDVERAGLLFRAVSGQYGDASRPRLGTGPDGSLPVYRYSVAETVGTGGQLAAAGARTEAIGLPPNIDLRRGELSLRLDPSLAAGLRDTLTYLEQYPYDGAVETASRFLPNLLTLQALQELGIRDAELEGRLPPLIEEGLSQLYSQQHSDGGWAWHEGDQSNPHVSAYVVFALLRADHAGHAVRGAVLSRGLDYLAGQIVASRDLKTTAAANQQAWLLYVLTEGGRAKPDLAEELYTVREKLSLYARALLALTLAKLDAAQHAPQLKTLLADLNSAAILSATGAHWEEHERDWWSMNTNTRTTAIVLAALVQLDPQNELLPNVVRWLMIARKDGVWETSQESAWAIIALTDWMRHTRELEAGYDYALWVNGAEHASGGVSSSNVAEPIVLRLPVADLLRDESNRLTVGRGDGPGRLYYTTHLRAFLPVEAVTALDRGIMVQRRYTLASCKDGPRCPTVRQVKIGDVIRVELSIVAPRDLYYVIVEDALPAGAEHIDASLATTSLLEQVAGDLQGGPPMPMPTEAEAAAEAAPGLFDVYWRWWNWYSRSELRDERVTLFSNYLPRGTYVYSYTIRATLPGEFRVIPATAEEAYFPEVHGRSNGDLLRIVR